MKTRCLLLIALLFCLTACGFHMRGAEYTDGALSGIYIQSQDARSLGKEMTAALAGLGATPALSANSAEYTVTLTRENIERSVLSVSSETGKVEEYQLVYTVHMDVADRNGKMLATDDRISVARDFTFDEDAVLGKFSEETVIRENLTRLAANRALRRLQALIRADR